MSLVAHSNLEFRISNSCFDFFQVRLPEEKQQQIDELPRTSLEEDCSKFVWPSENMSTFINSTFHKKLFDFLFLNPV